LQVQLKVLEDPEAADKLVKLSVVVRRESSSTSDSCTAADISSKSSAVGLVSSTRHWQTPGLLHRFSRKGSTSSKEVGVPRGEDSCQVSEASGQDITDEVPGDKAAEGDVLEGDIWSVMARLKDAGSSLLAPNSAAAVGSEEENAVSTVTAAAAAEAALAQQLQQQGEELLQQLLAGCCQVCSAAAQTKGCLGEECLELLKLVQLMTQLLHHGLCNAVPAVGVGNVAESAARAEDSSGRGAGSIETAKRLQTAAVKAAAGAGPAARGMTMAARGKLSGWLSGRPITAFGVGGQSRHVCLCGDVASLYMNFIHVLMAGLEHLPL
jgi:hypothetical protein